MQNPKVSILLPTYNRGYILSRAIESVLKQTFLYWELIIVDDGSTDDSKKVVKKYFIDKRIKYFNIEHGGQMKALNFGFEKSKADVIAFLDSDDWYDEKHLKIGLDYFQNNLEVDFVSTKLIVIGDQYVVDMRDITKKISVEECNPQGGFLIKREVIERLGGFPKEEYGSDYLFYNLAKEKGFIVHNIPERTYFFDRTRDDSVTKKKTKEILLKNQK